MTAARISRLWLEPYGFSTSLPRTEGCLVDLVPSNNDLKVLAHRLDNLEKAVTLGRDKDLFNLAYCIFKHTGIEVIPGVSGGTFEPRPVDHETMTLVLSAYRTLDVHLFDIGALPQAGERVPRSPFVNEIQSPHVTEDWTRLAKNFARLMDPGENRGVDGPTDCATSGATPDERFFALFKKMLKSQNKTSLSHIFDNFYACSVYLMSLCDPASVEDPFTVTSAKRFFRKWYEELPLPDAPASLTATERERLRRMADANFIKGIELCMEIAFMASPILLLRTFDVAKQKLHSSVGNDKPPIMTNVERALYGSIFDIAFAGATCSHSLSKIAVIIENGLGDLSTAIPGWFQTGPAVPSRDKDEDEGHGRNSDDNPDLEESNRPKKRLRLTNLEPTSSAQSYPPGLGDRASSSNNAMVSFARSRSTYGYDFGQPTLLSTEDCASSTPNNTVTTRLLRNPSALDSSLVPAVSLLGASPASPRTASTSHQQRPVLARPTYVPLWTFHSTMWCGAVSHPIAASSS
ncbi:hypothetical protein NMY22_g19058 [Coprinellus aureogranulatus]|nr:hypothetical protein NMY22_g19058 [Coprinellus aureogranulatus]